VVRPGGPPDFGSAAALGPRAARPAPNSKIVSRLHRYRLPLNDLAICASALPVIIDSHQDFDYTPAHHDDQGWSARQIASEINELTHR
jgi:hypothetical protein